MRESFLDLATKRARPKNSEIHDDRRRANQQPAINDAKETADAALAQPPVGAGMEWYGHNLPSDGKWLLCDGSEIPINDYPELYAVLAQTWDYGGTTTGYFRLPDRRQRVGVGAGPTRTGLTARLLSALFGSETHTLTTGQIPSHSHTGSTGSAGNHFHELKGNADTDDSAGLEWRTNANKNLSLKGMLARGTDFKYWKQITSQTRPDTTSDGAHTHTVNIGNTGESNSHNNIQPTITVHYILRARP